MVDNFSSKKMPSDPNLEKIVLGGLMLDKNSFQIVRQYLNNEDFYETKNQYIFQAIENICLRGAIADLASVMQEMKKMEILEKCGGISYLMEVTNDAISTANIEYHSQIVRDFSVKRQMITESIKTLRECFLDRKGALEIANMMDAATLQFKSIFQKNSKKTKSEVVRNVMESITTPSQNGFKGLPFTDVTELNQMINGVRKGDLCIIAARPSMGKSMLANGIMSNLAKNGFKGLLWGLEMSSEQNLERFISAYSDVSFSKLSKGQIDISDIQTITKIEEATKVFMSDALFFEEKAGVNAMDIRSRLYSLKSTIGIDYAIVDHGGLMNHNLTKEANGSAKIGETTKMLKQTAKDLDIPIILLWQLNRGTDNNVGKMPSLVNLRGSGRVEEDADKIIFIHREEYYEGDGNIQNGETTLKIDKCRNGKCGIVKVKFNPERARFEKLQDQYFGKGFEPANDNPIVDIGTLRKVSNDVPF